MRLVGNTTRGSSGPFHFGVDPELSSQSQAVVTLASLQSAIHHLSRLVTSLSIAKCHQAHYQTQWATHDILYVSNNQHVPYECELKRRWTGSHSSYVFQSCCLVQHLLSTISVAVTKVNVIYFFEFMARIKM